MVWSSNRDQMVQENATLTLTSTGELVLEDSDGNLVWSTNTFTQAFLRRVTHESGNLVLYKTSGGIIWQSFDYPTDTILLGQKLKISPGTCRFRVILCPARQPVHPYLFSRRTIKANIFISTQKQPLLQIRLRWTFKSLLGPPNSRKDLPRLLAVLYVMSGRGSCREMHVKHFASKIARAKLLFQSKGKHNKYLVVIICASVGGAITLLILLWAWINKSQNGRQQKEKDEDEDEDDHGNWPAGLPLRYTFQELKNGTNYFSVKLGSRGFGSVYEGVLADGSKIAVKRLDGAGQG
ncbi:uncharacterized protein LOC131036861 [Cryptomeria japonica]|uniref:uncharacterized protein LOC131036861 n=1 Tax=Cryptomeria japonica TaxID=3369 RepID=UPI0025ABCAF0|nr:uncharacterized protein LOC131036861 [Cryptomeria japonica]